MSANSAAMAQNYAKGSLIGRGTFGEVFLGKELSTQQDVALKLVDLEQADEEIEVCSVWKFCRTSFQCPASLECLESADLLLFCTENTRLCNMF